MTLEVWNWTYACYLLDMSITIEEHVQLHRRDFQSLIDGGKEEQLKKNKIQIPPHCHRTTGLIEFNHEKNIIHYDTNIAPPISNGVGLFYMRSHC